MGSFNVLIWSLIGLVCFFPMLNNFKGVAMAFHKVSKHLQHIMAFQIVMDHKTRFHFQPKRNWINDPNAPMYYKGLYHLFYQYSPKGSVWGNIVWAHSISKDLINWESLEPSIEPSKPFDKFGCWSGSATILQNDKPVILYTGLTAEKPEPGYQVQNYAIPENYSDPFLRKWIKPDDNPIIKPTNENVSAFRDPTTAWKINGQWEITIGSSVDMLGISYLYRSLDFITWTLVDHPLHQKENLGMWECPDFYPVATKGEKGLDTIVIEGDIKHVFKLIPRTVWLDPSEKQLLLWPVAELETLKDKKVQLSNKEIKKGDRVEVKGITAAQADVDVVFKFSSLDKAEKYDVKWQETFPPETLAKNICQVMGTTKQGGLGPFGLLTLSSNNLEEYTPVFFRVFNTPGTKRKVFMCSDAKLSTLNHREYRPSFGGFVDVDLADNRISLRSLIDHSAVESFAAGGKTVITSRVYPTLAVGDKTHLHVFNNGSETIIVERLDAWSIKTPKMN